MELPELPELDRPAAARHFLSLASHLTALAKLYDPSAKASKRAEADGADGRKAKRTREPSLYNKWMQAQLPRFKQEHPGMAQKDCFGALAAVWNTSPDNPKNAGGAAPQHDAEEEEPAEAAERKKEKKHKKHRHDNEGGAEGAEDAAGVGNDGEHKKKKKKKKHAVIAEAAA